MKLTKTIRQDFVAAVLANEVKSPDFAALTNAAWKEIISPMMPLAVAAVYNDPRTEDWVTAGHKYGGLVHEAQMRRERGDLSAEQLAGFVKLDEIENMRDKHSRNVANIRDAINTAAASVTTVLGMKKLFPQYAKYLPGEAARPGRLEAQVAIANLDASIAIANAPAKRRRAKKAVK